MATRTIAIMVVAAAGVVSPSNALLPESLQAAESVTVVARGLVNPRGIAQAPNGWMYVAEAGRGGDGCAPGPCLGPTGALTRIDPTGVLDPVRVVSGLPSIHGGNPALSVGPNDVSFQGTGGAYVVMGLGGNPDALRPLLGAEGALLGHVLKVSASGQYKPVSDISDFEARNNPADPNQDPDSNPYGIVALAGRQVVADAGANTLIESRANGSTRLLAVFPRLAPPLPPSQAVPTAVAEGPDGYLYVGQLTGGPFVRGAASVWRVPPEGGTPEVCAGGFSTIVDVTFDPYGHMYVLEMSRGNTPPPVLPPFANPPGRLSRVDACGAAPVVIYDQLLNPGGVAIGLDGAAYVTNRSTDPVNGEVLRIPLY